MMWCRVLLFCVVAAVVTAEDEESDPVTVTPSGAVRGSWMETRRGRRFQAYRGIRYAEPPVGELRFQPPKLIENYEDEVNATVDGPACPQPVSDGYYVDEDCLRINVYTSGNSTNMPVIVYMHAGGFYSVSGRSDVAGPSYHLERDVVFVTINYRLATLGFLSTGDEYAPGNNGFKDQVAALKWIQRNIAAFGGDPSLVTLTGYSAGSLSVGLHMISPMSKGLFHRAISMSSSAISQVKISNGQLDLAERQAGLLGCPTDSSKEIVECLKNVTWEEIGGSLDSMFEYGYDPIYMWFPVIEPDFGQERFLIEQPLDSIQEGRMHPVPLIISQTEDEFFWKAYNILNNATRTEEMNSKWDLIAPISFLLPDEEAASKAGSLKEFYLDGKDLENTTAVAEGLGNLYSDSVIGFSVYRMANLMSRYSPHPVYHYEFSYVGNSSHYVDPDTNKPIKAAHHDDLLYLITVEAWFPVVELGTEDNEIVEKLAAIWYNFARFGNPNPCGDTPELGDLSWPAMTPDDRQYLRVDQEFSIHKNLFEDRYAIWDELYPIEY